MSITDMMEIRKLKAALEKSPTKASLCIDIANAYLDIERVPDSKVLAAAIEYARLARYLESGGST
jgi:hypothetical protein